MSTAFQRLCATGQNVATVTLYFVPARSGDVTSGPGDSATIVFNNVRVASDVWSGGFTGAPVEALTMQYSRFRIKYSSAPTTTTSTTTTASTTTTTIYHPPPTTPQ